MPGDEISCPIHVIFYGDNFTQSVVLSHTQLSQMPQAVALRLW